LSFTSVAIGLIVGFIATLLTKNVRSLSHSAVAESTLMISMAMAAYLIAELFGFSAIACLLTCSIVLSHYTWFNLSPQG
jgi:sodium/hydrogen exchanger-like protein 6/7/sodium/hydrogen exchanger 8